MNIAFFLIPKAEVEFLNINCTMRQALEKMEYHSYTAIPLIDDNGRYAGTLTEGDLLRKIKQLSEISLIGMERVHLTDLTLLRTNRPVKINAKIEDLFELILMQNFVPVVDDKQIFIGIIRRREIIDHYMSPRPKRSLKCKKAVLKRTICFASDMRFKIT